MEVDNVDWEDYSVTTFLYGLVGFHFHASQRVGSSFGCQVYGAKHLTLLGGANHINSEDSLNDVDLFFGSQPHPTHPTMLRDSQPKMLNL